MPNHATPQLTADEITEAYVYLLGRYLVIRQDAIDVAEPGVEYNVLKHNPPVNAGDTSGSAPTFVNPNLDVVYSEAWFAVDADTPVILEIPEIPAGLYYTAQIVDEWAEITHNINERNFPDHPVGRFAICLAGLDTDHPGRLQAGRHPLDQGQTAHPGGARRRRRPRRAPAARRSP